METEWKSGKTQMNVTWEPVQTGIRITRIKIEKQIKGMEAPIKVDARGSVTLTDEELLGWMLRHLSIDALPARVAREGDTLANLCALGAETSDLDRVIGALSEADRKALRRDVVDTARRYRFDTSGTTAELLRRMAQSVPARMRIGADWPTIVKAMEPFATIEAPAEAPAE